MTGCRAELTWTVGATFRGFAVVCDVTGEHLVHSAPLAGVDGVGRVRVPETGRWLRRRARGPRRATAGSYDPVVLDVRVTWRDPR